ncbi:hypothetical protein DFH11DRAFT_1620349 [Phellopilus nigrolimitatus]|nr:hypothetical protein DFH11DRAFT_1620349 [Phellopilus nigrolimitatus]
MKRRWSTGQYLRDEGGSSHGLFRFLIVSFSLLICSLKGKYLCIELCTYLRDVTASCFRLSFSFFLCLSLRSAMDWLIFILLSLNVCPHTCLIYISSCSSSAVWECFIKSCRGHYSADLLEPWHGYQSLEESGHVELVF